MKELVSIQSELKAPKGQYNSFGKYKYRSAEDILEAVKPLCAKYGCELTLSDEMVYIGNRYYIKATANLEHEGSDPVSVTAYAREAGTKKGMDESQITGAASSYARKYALNGPVSYTHLDVYKRQRYTSIEACVCLRECRPA